MGNKVENIEFEELENESATGSKPLVQRDASLIGHINVHVTVQVGEISIDVEKLFKMAVGDVLQLNQNLDEPLTLLIDGKPIAKGVLVAVDDCFGIQITETAD